MRVVERLDARLRSRASPRLHRAAYRVGYLVLRPWWLVSRPRIRGVKAVVGHDGRVLLVRHAYGRRHAWDLPGGFVRAGEAPEASLRRELREELGIAQALRVRDLGVGPARTDGKRESLHVFAVDVAAAVVRPDPAEIADVRWVVPGRLPPGTTRYARRMVARAGWDSAT